MCRGCGGNINKNIDYNSEDYQSQSAHIYLLIDIYLSQSIPICLSTYLCLFISDYLSQSSDAQRHYT